MASALIGAHGVEHMYGPGSFSVLVAAIYADLGLDPIQAALLLAVRQLTSGITSIFSGFSVDIFQHRRAQVLAVSIALIGIGYFLVSVSPTYGLILAALVVASAGGGPSGILPLWGSSPSDSHAGEDCSYPFIVPPATLET